MHKLTEYSKQVRPLIEREIEALVKRKIDNYTSLYGESSFTELLAHIKNLIVSNGKKIRPLVTLCTFQMLTGREVKRSEILAAVALELNHQFLLIHDDIADNDKIRYGGKNLYGIYEDYAKERFTGRMITPDRYGLSVSMVAGDLVHNFVYDALNTADFAVQIKNSLYEELTRIIEIAAYGWKDQYDLNLKPVGQVSEKEIIENIKMVTAAYTIEGPMRFGGILSGMLSTKDFNNISEIGVNLGIAHQLKDDLLGLFDSKEVASDIKEGKKSLHLAHSYNNSDDSTRKYLDETVGSSAVTKEDIAKIKAIVVKAGSKEYAERTANDYVHKALEALEMLRFKNEFSEVFKDLANFVANRAI
ncbi:polyprenyl synthetase family protein [candidate division WWE3 bacterium]|nr:polyprenyl synthetase family protein [candidate division WWE3 bacterium]